MPIKRVQRDDQEADSDVIRPTSFGSNDDDLVSRSFRDQQAGSNLLRTGTEFQARGSAGGRRRAPSRPPSRAEAPPPPDTARLQDAARNLVTAQDRGENRDVAGDKEALFSPGAGIGGLDENAVAQEGGRFKSVTDPGSGFTVPNLADEETKGAFNRFFANQRNGFSDAETKQKNRNADPTRVAFQNRFFPSETLKDAGV